MSLSLKTNNRTSYVKAEDELKIQNLKNAVLRGEIDVAIPNLIKVLNVPFFISKTFNEIDKEDLLKSVLKNVYDPMKNFLSAKNYILDSIDMKWAINKEPIQTDILSNELKLSINLAEGPFFFYILLKKNDEMFAPNEMESKIVEKLKDLPGFSDFIKYYKNDINRDDDENEHHLYILNRKLDLEVPVESQQSRSFSNSISSSTSLRPSLTKIDSTILTELYRINRETYGVASEFEIELKKIKNTFNFIEYKVSNVIKDCAIELFFFIKKDVNDEFLNFLDELFNYYSSRIYNSAFNVNNESLISPTIRDIEKRLGHDGNYKPAEMLPRNNNVNVNFFESITFLDHVEKFMSNCKFYIDIYQRRQNSYMAGLESSRVNYLDLLHHIKFLQIKCKSFKSRSDLLNTARTNIDRVNGKQYQVYVGPSGCGKTSLISKISKDNIFYLYEKSKTIQIIRFIGTSEDSHNIQTILKSIIFQLSELLSCDETEVDENDLTPIHNLYKYFRDFLKKIGNLKKFEDFNFFLILDSLDQLSDDHSSKSLEWIPLNLPKNFRIVLSTIKPDADEIESNDGRFQPFSILNSTLHDNLIQIPFLTENEIEEVYKKTFEDAKRKLQPDQKSELFVKLNDRASPLYVKIMIDQALKWDAEFDVRSFNENIGNDVEAVIEKIIEEVEKQFIKPLFVQRILKYISINKYGLDINQLIEVLASDQTLVYEIQNYFGCGIQNCQVSKLFIMQVLYLLRDYLSRPRYNWYHRKFIQAAKKRYCHEIRLRDDNVTCFNRITSCYGQYKFSDDSFWIRVLPFLALYSSHDSSTLRDEYLLSIEFMMKKIEKCYVDELINDYQSYFKLRNNTSNPDRLLKALNYILIDAATSIRTSPNQLPGHLLGYLLSNDEHRQILNEFNERCKNLLFPAIIPNKRFLSMDINKQPTISICGMSEIKSVARHFNHIYVSTDSFIVQKINPELLEDQEDNQTRQSNIENEKKIKRHSMNTTKLMILNDDKDTRLFAWSDKTEENDETLIEMYNLTDQNKEKKCYRHKFQSSTQIRLIQGKTKQNVSFLWLLTSTSWHNIIIEEMIDAKDKYNTAWLNENFNGDAICFASNHVNTLYFAFNNSSKIHIINVDDKLSREICLNNSNVVTGNKFLLLEHENILLVATKTSRKSIYRENEDEHDYHLKFFNIETCEEKIESSFTVGYELDLYEKIEHKNAKIIFAASFDLLLVIKTEIQNQIYKTSILYKLEHGSIINDFLIINDEKVMTACDNRFNIWPNLTFDNNQVDRRDEKVNYNSKNVLVFYDSFENRSPFVLVYNLFDYKNKNEYLTIFDLHGERMIRQYRFKEAKIRNDLEPVAIIDMHFILYCRSSKSYLILDIDFNIKSGIRSGEIRLFKRLNKEKFLINIKLKEDDYIDTIFIFQITGSRINFDERQPVTAWHNIQAFDIDWYLASFNSILYKKSTSIASSEIILCDLNGAERSIQNIPELNENCKKKISDDGKYLIVLSQLDIVNDIEIGNLKVYDLQSLEAIYEVQEDGQYLMCTKNFHIFNNNLIYEVSERFKFVTYFTDLTKRRRRKTAWIKCSKGNYNINTNFYGCYDGIRLTRFLWCEQKFEDKKSKRIIKNEIYMLDFENIDETVKTCLNTGNKLKDRQFFLINYGQGFLAKKLNLLDFVIFSISSLRQKPDLRLENNFERIEGGVKNALKLDE